MPSKGVWNCPGCNAILSASQSQADCLTCAAYAFIFPQTTLPLTVRIEQRRRRMTRRRSRRHRRRGPVNKTRECLSGLNQINFVSASDSTIYFLGNQNFQYLDKAVSLTDVSSRLLRSDQSTIFDTVPHRHSLLLI